MEVKDLKEVVKEKLGESYSPEFDAKLGEEKVLLDPKNFVPLTKLDNANSEIKLLKDQLAEKDKASQEMLTKMEKDLKEMKKAADGNPELVKGLEGKIGELKDEVAKSKEGADKAVKEMINFKKKAALTLGLNNHEVHNPKHQELLVMDIINKIGIDKIELDEHDMVKNLDEIIKPYEEDTKTYNGFFGKEEVRGNEHRNGGDPNLTGEYFTREQIEKMTPQFISENRDKVNKSMERIK